MGSKDVFVWQVPLTDAPPFVPRRMLSHFDIPLNAVGEKVTITHPAPLTTRDIHHIRRYLDMLKESDHAS